MVSGLFDDVTRGQVDGLERDLRGRVNGEVRFDPGTRGAYSTDASNFRQVPIGVVLPRTPEAAVEAVAVCREYDVPVLSRGGGTSLAGQCTNAAVMLDWSKYCHRVESVDKQERTCIVEPGIVLDLRNENLSGRSLRFGPEPATHMNCIRERYPDIPRRVSGYNLDSPLPEHGFDIAGLLVGSESTLVTVLGAKLKLAQVYCHQHAVLGWDAAALRAARR